MHKFLGRSVTTLLLATALHGLGIAQAPPKFRYLIGGDVWGLTFLDSDHGLTVEDGGRVRRWDGTDNSWYVHETPDGVRGDLRGVFYRTQTEVWACGDDGVVLKSTDGGQTWTWQNPPPTFDPVLDAFGDPARLFGIWMLSSTDGWCIGEDGALRVTGDGGQSWSEPPNLPGAFDAGHDPHDIYDIHFFDSQYGVLAADYGRLWRTDDAGLNWEEIVVAEPPYSSSSICPTPVADNVEFWSFDFEQPTNKNSPGWAVGGDGTTRGYTLRINDLFATPASWEFRPCYFDSLGSPPAPDPSNNCIPTMYSVCMLGTSSSWRPVMTGYQQRIHSYEAVSPDCTCDANHCPGTAAWKRQTTIEAVSNPPQWAIARKSATEAIAGGRFGMLRKFTAPTSGTTGTVVDEVFSDRFRLHDALFFDSDVGIGITQGHRIVRTTNGGATWSVRLASDPLEPSNMQGAIAKGGTSGTRCVAVGKNRFCAYSTNSGLDWTLVDPTSFGHAAYDLLGVEFVPGTNDVFAVGTSGRVSHSTDGGATWTNLIFPSEDRLSGVSFVLDGGALKGFVVGTTASGGTAAVAYRSVDGGANWASIGINGMTIAGTTETEPVRGFNDVVTWGDATAAIAVGTDGAIHQRTSGNFEYQEIDLDPGTGVVYPKEEMFDVELATTSTNVRISGDEGRVLFRDSGTWTWPKTQSSDHLIRAAFLSASHGWVFGQKFTVCEYE